MYTIGVNSYTKWKRRWLFLFFAAIFLMLFILFINTDYFDTRLGMLVSPSSDALYLNTSESIETRVADLLSRMTLEEKIGQMALVEKNSLEIPNDITEYKLGGVLSGSGAKPKENTAEGWKEMIEEYQLAASKTRLQIPLLYGSDAIHGHAHVPGATIFPHQIGLGATGNTALVKEVAKATAEELLATGVNWNFAPNLDTPQDIRWGRVYESFSDDPKLVAKLARSYIEGLQSNDNNDHPQAPVLATAKHFIGLGGMSWGTSLNKDFKIDQGVTKQDDRLLREVYLPPFIEALEAGALSVMVGLNTWDNDRMVRQKQLLTDVLKTELGFKGFVVSDWYGVHEGKKNTFLATVQAINAGVDMVMLPFDYQSFVRHVKWANRLGLVTDERIDDAVSRILYAKFAIGLFDIDSDTLEPDSAFSNTNRALAREAVSQSLVLLKNEADTLPLAVTTQTIHVAGSAADNIGQQTGGWTVEWQGIDGNWLPEATSIYEGIKNLAEARGGQVAYNRLGVFDDTGKMADVGIAVVGEKPYAEGWGDTEYPILNEEDLRAIKNLQMNSRTIIVVLVSGRPLLIEREINSFDALVAAWLPGSEGAGVADVLFGEKPFTGKLPLPWPAHSEQLPILPDGQTNDKTTVLFPRYYGL